MDESAAAAHAGTMAADRDTRLRDRPGPPDQRARSGLDGLLADLAGLAEGRDRVTLGEVLEALGARGHGPIILVLALLMLMPTGLVPFMPTIIGILLVLTAVQMAIGGKGVTLPRRLAHVGMPGRAIRAGLARSAPVFRRIGRLLHPRLDALVSGRPVLLLIAAILVASGGVMAVIGGIPGLPFLLCLPALFFGFGLTAGDGLVVALGIAATVGATMGVVWLI
jgi:hypothetical protein